MSHKAGPIFVICGEPDGKCELCGKTEETRPYGPGGKRICFGCSQSSKEMQELAVRQFARVLDGKPPEQESETRTE